MSLSIKVFYSSIAVLIPGKSFVLQRTTRDSENFHPLSVPPLGYLGTRYSREELPRCLVFVVV